MIRFRTEYTPRPADHPLDPERGVTLLGSCFADNIGVRMRRSLWNATVNPCGTLFNPASIKEILRLASENNADLILREREGLHVSMMMDSSFASTDPHTCSRLCRQALATLSEALPKSGALIVTLGTAWIYEECSSGRIVTNCHKFPAQEFRRRRLTLDECSLLLNEIERLAKNYNPDIRVIFTVSPVRHLRDDIHENTLSKSTLLLATESHEYFPAYEILLDDLRDYRFYGSDLSHPSDEAIEYIWEKFLDRYVSRQGRLLLREGEALANRLAHRPINPDSAEAKRFSHESIRLLADFLGSHPGMLDPNAKKTTSAFL